MAAVTFFQVHLMARAIKLFTSVIFALVYKGNFLPSLTFPRKAAVYPKGANLTHEY